MSNLEPQENHLIADGHKLIISWVKDTVSISEVVCPHEGKSALCNRLRKYCVVERFIDVYGTECNLGSTVVNGPVEIAWVPIAGESDIDNEFAQVWICPIDDPDYLASLDVDPE